jgi:N-acetylneuraminic acid mutarotase
VKINTSPSAGSPGRFGFRRPSQVALALAIAAPLVVLGAQSPALASGPLGSLTAASAAASTTASTASAGAGNVTVKPAVVSASVGWGKTSTQKLTIKNTAKKPATVTISATPGTVAPAGQGAPLQLVKEALSPLPVPVGKAAPKTARTATVTPAVAGDAWQTAADFPIPIADSAVDSYDGKIYSSFGDTIEAFGKLFEDNTDLYSYDPAAGAWTQLASSPDMRQDPVHGFIDGKLYVYGGGAVASDRSVDVYDPSTDTWSKGPSNAPRAFFASGSAVLGGKLYSVGGCVQFDCGTAAVTAYDPATDTWSTPADYPVPVSWASCAGIQGKLYCAGGVTSTNVDASEALSSAYVYDPADNTWSALPDLPFGLWGSAYSAANGQLVVAAGATQTGVTNQSFAFDPAANIWNELPSANVATYRTGGALGFYKVGGQTGINQQLTTVELLPGYDQADPTTVPWLSTADKQIVVPASGSATIAVTLDASVPAITQPGTYAATLHFTSDTPNAIPSVPVSLTIAPPKTWAEVSGTVLSGATSPLGGATVQIDSWASDYTLTTDKDGHYELWLDARNSPLTVIVAKDGYQPTVATVKIKKGDVITHDVTLKKA